LHGLVGGRDDGRHRLLISETMKLDI
jgi:hypothetical protein